MEGLTLFQRLCDWIDKTFYYNCEKGRHEWCYRLEESGVVYIDEEKVPKELWRCRRCELKKH